jgi:hypothetical protein
MTKNEIEHMWKVASNNPNHDTNWNDAVVIAFAKLVAQHEREACAEIAEKQRYAMDISLTSHPAQNGTAVGILNQIRARGEA